MSCQKYPSVLHVLAREPVLTLAVKTLLVAERIDASLLAFLALSNQLVHQAESVVPQTVTGQLNTNPS